MAISREEIERSIPGSVYCGNCGYNLKTLPYVYTCPECGSEYNARPLKMCGVFLPSEAEIPLGDLAGVAACALTALVFAYGGIKPPDVFRLCAALIFAVFAILLARRAYVRMRRFFRATAIARRIAADDEG